MNPFINWEGCIKDWCGPSQPPILCTFNITALPLLYTLRVLCNFLFVPQVLSLIRCSSIIYFTSPISTELRKWAQFEKPLTSYIFSVYLRTSIGTRKPGCYITIHLLESPEGAMKVKELTFAPFLFCYAPAFSWFCLWDTEACPTMYPIQCSAATFVLRNQTLNAHPWVGGRDSPQPSW